MVIRAPGDAVSKTLLGAANFFKRIKTEAISNQSYIRSFILSTNMLIGIVADPQLSEADNQFSLICAIADQCHGQIFNGRALLNSFGEILLDDQGAFDVRLQGERRMNSEIIELLKKIRSEKSSRGYLMQAPYRT